MLISLRISLSSMYSSRMVRLFFSSASAPYLASRREFACTSREQEADDETEQTEDGAEDLNDKDLYKSVTMLDVDWIATDFSSAHKLGSAASARAALLPLIPTDTPQIRLHAPTSTPDQKMAYPT